jgi:phosphotransferase system enzyme I (PtsI)
MDGFIGELEVSPSTSVLEGFKLRKKIHASEVKGMSAFRGKSTVTSDGHEFKLYANIGTHLDLTRVISNDAEGVGLFRSEFLFMDCNHLPTEDEQFSAYKEVVEGMCGKPVIVRTLDIGGDKELPLLGLDKEENPFLGQRAIRLCLNRPELFQTQLKALLRASVFGNLRIMFPMVSSLDELRAAKDQVEIAKTSLKKRGIRFSENVEVGIMIEIPAAAILADSFAGECDFFSIGTNDLIQYTVAVDRGNPKVSSIYTAYHPAVLRLISMTAEAARRNEIPCGMCGEAAADPLLIPIFLGFGLHELSMNPSSILPTRKHIETVNMADAIKLSKQVLAQKTAQEVQSILQAFADS